jgi:Heavy metal associated domain 2
MGLPGAYICHQSAQRLRIKITSRKGNVKYFENLQSTLASHRTFDGLEVNALTGSVLIVDEHVDVDDIADFAKARQLFELADQNSSHSPMTAQLVSHLENFNINLRRLTAGEMDLAGILLLFLLISGLTELLRGKIQMPPWYTAFWYAFGIYKLASVVKDTRPEEAKITDSSATL